MFKINRNISLKFKSNSSGFTLIELLVVIIILGFVGAISVGIISSALRSSNKSAAVNNIRQNGNYVLSQMTKMIAYTPEFKGVCGSPADCTLSSSYTVSCSDSGTSYDHLKIINPDGGETVFVCDLANNTIASVSAASNSPLTNTSDMKVTSCSFHCASFDSTVSPTISIAFTLTSNGTLAENKAEISFETSVKPRNNPGGP